MLNWLRKWWFKPLDQCHYCGCSFYAHQGLDGKLGCVQHEYCPGWEKQT